MKLSAPIDATLIDRAAQAAYQAAMRSVKNANTVEPWENLPEYWRRLYRVQAEAILQMIGGAS